MSNIFEHVKRTSLCCSPERPTQVSFLEKMECTTLRRDGDTYCASTSSGTDKLISESQLHASTLLTSVAQGLEEDGVVNVEAPMGYFEAWDLYKKTIVERDESNVLLEKLATAAKAAEFFEDSRALFNICRVIGKKFLHPVEVDVEKKTSGGDGVDTHHILDQLPRKLGVLVIQSIPFNLQRCLALLSERFHTLALCAHQPSLLSHNAISIHSAEFTSATAHDALYPMRLAAELGFSVHTLSICSPDQDLPSQAVNSLSALQCLTALKSCSISGGILTESLLQSLGEALQPFQNLHTLQLSRKYPKQQPQLPCANTDGHKGIYSLLEDGFSSLSCLELCGIAPGPEGLIHSSLNGLSRLHTLKLMRGATNTTTLEQIANGCKSTPEHSLPNLEELSLSGNHLGEDGIMSVLSIISSCTHLTHIDLSWNRLGDAAVQQLAAVLPLLPDLCVLNISGNKMGEAGACAVCDSLAVLTNIQRLDFGKCDAPCSAVSALACAVNRLPDLVALNIDRWKLVESANFTAAEEIAEVLEGRHMMLDLSFVHTQMNTEALCVLAPSLSMNDCLRSLDLMGNQIADAGVLVLSQELSKLCNLELFRLEVVDVEGEVVTNCVVDFADSLKGLVKLRVLELMGLDAAEDDAVEFVGALRSLTCLQELSLIACGISTAAAVAFSDALRQMIALKKLCLGSNLLRDEGALKISEALDCALMLEEVDLRSTGITGRSATGIVNALESHRFMQSCHIIEGNHSISGSVVQSLKCKPWVV